MRRGKPAVIPPIFCNLSFLVNARINAPTPASVANITDVETELPPNIPNATSCPVIVVPMFAPNMTVAA